MKISHQEAFELMMLAGAGRLNTGQSQRLADHLAGCESCRANQQLLAKLSASRSARQPVPGDPALTSRSSLTALQSQIRRKYFMNRAFHSTRALAYSLAGVLIVVGIFWLFVRSKPVYQPLAAPSPTAAARPTSTPTNTPTPTPVPDVKAPPTAGPDAELSPFIVPTLSPSQLTALDALSAGLEPELTWQVISPDGKWMAGGLKLPEVELEGNYYYYNELTVTRPEWSRMPWMVYQNYETSGLGYTLPEVIGWSADGKYMYFTLKPRADGCALFFNASELRRVELESGLVDKLVPAENGMQPLEWLAADSPRQPLIQYVMSISPDGGTLAFPQMVDQLEQRWVLNLLDLETLIIQQVELPLPGDQLGSIVWSPDGAQLLVTISHNSCIIPDWSQAILLVDVSALTVSEVVQPDSRALRPIEWLENGQVRLLGGFEQIPYLLDLATGEITLDE